MRSITTKVLKSDTDYADSFTKCLLIIYFVCLIFKLTVHEERLASKLSGSLAELVALS